MQDGRWGSVTLPAPLKFAPSPDSLHYVQKVLSGQVKVDSRRAWKLTSGELKGIVTNDIYLKIIFRAKSQPRSVVRM